MKRILISTCCLICLCMAMCKKSDTKTASTATCTSCSLLPVIHKTDSSGACFFVPTAFTPNGDGVNDVYGLFYTNMDTDSCSMAVWNAKDSIVFNGKITPGWDGNDLNGNKCSAGQYTVFLQLKTSAGVDYKMCTCANLLVYTDSCIKTNGVTYYFEDQINDTAGFVFATNEILCP